MTELKLVDHRRGDFLNLVAHEVRTPTAVILGMAEMIHMGLYDGKEELYNLKNDPAEKTNLANKQKGVYNRLATKLRAQLQVGGAVPWQEPSK